MVCLRIATGLAILLACPAVLAFQIQVFGLASGKSLGKLCHNSLNRRLFVVPVTESCVKVAPTWGMDRWGVKGQGFQKYAVTLNGWELDKTERKLSKNAITDPSHDGPQALGYGAPQKGTYGAADIRFHVYRGTDKLIAPALEQTIEDGDEFYLIDQEELPGALACKSQYPSQFCALNLSPRSKVEDYLWGWKRHVTALLTHKPSEPIVGGLAGDKQLYKSRAYKDSEDLPLVRLIAYNPPDDPIGMNVAQVRKPGVGLDDKLRPEREEESKNAFDLSGMKQDLDENYYDYEDDQNIPQSGRKRAAVKAAFGKFGGFFTDKARDVKEGMKASVGSLKGKLGQKTEDFGDRVANKFERAKAKIGRGMDKVSSYLPGKQGGGLTAEQLRQRADELESEYRDLDAEYRTDLDEERLEDLRLGRYNNGRDVRRVTTFKDKFAIDSDDDDEQIPQKKLRRRGLGLNA